VVRPSPVPVRRPLEVKSVESVRSSKTIFSATLVSSPDRSLPDILHTIQQSWPVWRIRQSHRVPKQIGFQVFPDGHAARLNHLQKNTSVQLHSFSRRERGRHRHFRARLGPAVIQWRPSTAAPIRAATNMHVSGRISNKWKMRHQVVPPCRRFEPNQ